MKAPSNRLLSKIDSLNRNIHLLNIATISLPYRGPTGVGRSAHSISDPRPKSRGYSSWHYLLVPGFVVSRYSFPNRSVTHNREKNTIKEKL